MDNKALRKELQEISGDGDFESHAVKVAALSSRFGCSIRALSGYDQTSRKNFNCFEHALDLNEHLQNSTLITLSELGVLVDHHFIGYLKALGVLKEKAFDDLQDGDLVVYFDNTGAQHAGKWSRGRVISKWGAGLLYDHGLLETPLQYGTPRFFEIIPGPNVRDYLLKYAKEEKGVPEEYLE